MTYYFIAPNFYFRLLPESNLQVWLDGKALKEVTSESICDALCSTTREQILSIFQVSRTGQSFKCQGLVNLSNVKDWSICLENHHPKSCLSSEFEHRLLATIRSYYFRQKAEFGNYLLKIG